MKGLKDMNSCVKLALLGGALALGAGPAAAKDYYLAAKVFTKALPMSGGTTVNVPMWGYVEDTGSDTVAHCYDIIGAGSAAARRACVNALPDPVAPGPRLTVPPGQSVLRLFLTNGLPEPTSIIIPGQELPYSGATGPTWDDGSTGARGGDLSKRVRSYGLEAAKNGGRRSYLWNISRGNPMDRPGTFLYHSGTWPQKQVYMGLYGAVTKDFAVGQAYEGVPYDNEVVLFYSDIDPVINKSIAKLYAPRNPNYAGVAPYSTSIDYHAQWFLVNGEPYVDAANATADNPATADIPATTGQRTLVRFLSTASETHVPTLQGLYMTIHAEDSIRYNYQNGDAFGAFAPREQFTAELPPLKTKDAIISFPAPVPPATEARFAVYDGNGYMTNPSDPTNFAVGDTLGGMLRFLSTTGN